MNNDTLVNKLRVLYLRTFDTAHELTLFSPGRINLIGEHTDYNDGYVLPAAIAMGIYAVLGSSTQEYSTIYSVDFDEEFRFDIRLLKPLEESSWKNYVIGVIEELKKDGAKIDQMNMVFSGDIPRGAGLSSSASLENAVSFGINSLFELGYSRLTLAKIGQRAEHNYVGVKCGIMDQYSSLFGEINQALLLDCRHLTHVSKPLELGEYLLILLNSNVHHSLADSAYNTRREQCEKGMEAVKKRHGHVKALRDVTINMLAEIEGEVSEEIYRRCLYVIEENERVIEFGKALDNKDLIAAGRLLQLGQKGMRYQYEITCDEIDFLADQANQMDCVLGARMMGGGFGGCTINIVHQDDVTQFIATMEKEYLQRFDQSLDSLRLNIVSGVRLLP
ncbi:MAG: galactokinase [Cyclobacteriaceae bacterium]